MEFRDSELLSSSFSCRLCDLRHVSSSSLDSAVGQRYCIVSQRIFFFITTPRVDRFRLSIAEMLGLRGGVCFGYGTHHHDGDVWRRGFCYYLLLLLLLRCCYCYCYCYSTDTIAAIADTTDTADPVLMTN
ncbi:hypothetical protein EX30DRAFT_132001 [Ascodesmis nigricans]|uniref:Uncharacterized protein n=1 Tax=Ascodesmis nigricans TaxID=341454 RepID=A0A4S2MRK8_9PEZI|nr:hypothetical protein EX30DRAFT_132001 [Ascodesmis nigricans]